MRETSRDLEETGSPVSWGRGRDGLEAQGAGSTHADGTVRGCQSGGEGPSRLEKTKLESKLESQQACSEDTRVVVLGTGSNLRKTVNNR